MIGRYFRFDFGDSYIQGRLVIELIKSALPVYLSLWFWQLLISYSISIPLGIRKAIKEGEVFDVWTSIFINIGYAILRFLFGILKIVFFAGGSFLNWFPLSHLTSDNFDQLSFIGKILDYLYHLILASTVIGYLFLCYNNLANKKLFFRRNSSAVCYHSTS